MSFCARATTLTNAGLAVQLRVACLNLSSRADALGIASREWRARREGTGHREGTGTYLARLQRRRDVQLRRRQAAVVVATREQHVAALQRRHDWPVRANRQAWPGRPGVRRRVVDLDDAHRVGVDVLATDDKHVAIGQQPRGHLVSADRRAGAAPPVFGS